MAAAAAKFLAGKTALVTGSTSGIGLGVARAFAAAGANVMLHGLTSKAEGDKLVADFEKEFKVKVALGTHDMSRSEEVVKLMADTKSAVGAVDILVNNAGIQHVAPVESFPPEKWDQVLAINLTSCFHTTRLALPEMKAKKYGRIINIASVHGLVASANKSAYVAAKHGLVGFTKTVALETAGSGVTVNAICPGWVLTPLVQAQIDARAKASGKSTAEAQRDLLQEKQPSAQFVQPEHLASLAVFLASDAASQMTGVSLPMDGGWTSQ